MSPSAFSPSTTKKDALVDLPYYAPQHLLPALLPTDAAIRNSSDVLKTGYGRRVVRVDDHFVVKYGVTVSLTEGQNMLFVREACNVAVPQVFAIYSREDPRGASIRYIVMEYVDGKPLHTTWNTLSDPEKSGISQNLRSIFDALRRVPSPGYFGSIGRQPIEEGMLWTRIEDEPGTGPFDTEEQLNNAIVEKYFHSGSQSKAGFYRHILPIVLKDHKPVFTHGDFQRKNVLMGDGYSLILIDWESAGWYPSYWEYASAMFACGDWQDNWHEYVSVVLDEYPNEYAWFDIVRRELWS